MKSLISNKEFYRRHNQELEKYLIFKNTLHLINKNSANKVSPQGNIIEYIDLDENLSEQLRNLEDNKFELIILSDIIEIYDDIFDVFQTFETLLTPQGSLLVTSINTKWKLPLKLMEFLKLKQKTSQFSYIHNKKIENISLGAGYDLVATRTRQLFPFKLFLIGNFINKFLEIILFNFDLGIRTYILFRKNTKTEQQLKKTIIVPAKNEEGNLIELISRIPKFSETEIILSIGNSKDRTLEVANEIKDNNTDFEIQVIEQTGIGKANAVWEAAEVSKGDVLAILDSDISVDPEELEHFFEIIEKNFADFVNGTRLIYEMEKGSMRFINKIGNRFFQYFIGKIINEPITDSLCGTKVFKKNLIKNINWWQQTYRMHDPFGDFDLLFAASYSGAKILEYPIHYRARKYGVTQISRFKDGFKLIRYLIKSFIVINTSK
tara:strand:+ start:1799 stop:3103 length:1305 start_codon:yes stop_codon:yes gene_type:complete